MSDSKPTGGKEEKPSQSTLAKRWGVTRQYVYKLVKLGMPLTSFEAAEKWRGENQQRAKVRPPKEDDFDAPPPKIKTEAEVLAENPPSAPPGFKAGKKKPAKEEDKPLREVTSLEPQAHGGALIRRALTGSERPSEVLEAGFKLEVERLSQLCADGAARVHQSSGATRYQAVREYALLTDTWRKLAKDVPEIERLAGDSIAKSEVEKYVGEAFTAISKALDAMPNRVGPLLHGKSVVDIIEAMKDEVVSIKRNLEGELGG